MSRLMTKSQQDLKDLLSTHTRKELIEWAQGVITLVRDIRQGRYDNEQTTPISE